MFFPQTLVVFVENLVVIFFEKITTAVVNFLKNIKISRASKIGVPTSLRTPDPGGIFKPVIGFELPINILRNQNHEFTQKCHFIYFFV